MTRVFRFIWAALTRAVDKVLDALGLAIELGLDWLYDSKKALYGLAVTRIVFGLAMLGLLLANFGTRLYTFGSGAAWNGEAVDPQSAFPKIWLFSLFHSLVGNDALFTAAYIGLIALVALFIVGWRFRVVAPLVFIGWVSFIELNDTVGDQSDNMSRIALLLFLFADPAARWSFDAARRARKGEWFPAGSGPAQIGTVLHNLALVALAAQVFMVYVSGGLYKAQGAPWAGGWAVYNPLHTQRFGPWPELSELLTSWGPMVAIASWGSILLQIAFPLLLLIRPTRLIALVSIITFHIAIGIAMGLPWFSLTMIAIDSIFIRDRSWVRIGDTTKRLWRDAAGPTVSSKPAAQLVPDPATAAAEGLGAARQ